MIWFVVSRCQNSDPPAPSPVTGASAPRSTEPAETDAIEEAPNG